MPWLGTGEKKVIMKVLAINGLGRDLLKARYIEA
jgi:hypothetical protein